MWSLRVNPFIIGKGQYMFGIEVKIGPNQGAKYPNVFGASERREAPAYFPIYSHMTQASIVFKKKQMR